MQLTVLGSGTCIPRLERAEPSYLLKVGRELLLLDCSVDAKQQMLRSGAHPKDISRILITHTHPDHSAGLAGLFWSYGASLPHGRKTPITVYGPKGFRQYFKLIMEKIVRNKMPFGITVKEMGNSKARVSSTGGSFTIESKIINHMKKVRSIGYRITPKGKVFVYSGDAEYSKNLVKLSRDADLLLLDCAKVKPRADHLTPEECGILASQAGAKKVVLTHFYPDVERVNIKKLVRKNFKGKIAIAKDLMKVKI